MSGRIFYHPRFWLCSRGSVGAGLCPRPYSRKHQVSDGQARAEPRPHIKSVKRTLPAPFSVLFFRKRLLFRRKSGTLCSIISAGGSRRASPPAPYSKKRRCRAQGRTLRGAVDWGHPVRLHHPMRRLPCASPAICRPSPRVFPDFEKEKRSFP